MSGEPTTAEVTTLLIEWRGGDNQARDQLVGMIYGELRRMAAAALRREVGGQTLQPTELVHELYLRLFQGTALQPVDRKHLFAIMARQMRRILIDRARSRKAEKRDGGRRVELDEAGAQARDDGDVLLIDEALTKLAKHDERCAQVVELRFFGGLTEVETAETLDISVATVKRDWDFARAWLYEAITLR